ncbi:MAG: methyltransferase domain-containing protein [Gemmatimonadota bacterium]
MVSASPALLAFDAMAPAFDQRFSGWRSVAAQRRAVRRELLDAFPPGSRLLELGGGTGVDAIFMADQGREVLLTDGAPAMVARANQNIRAVGLSHRVSTQLLAIEQLPDFASQRAARPLFQGAYSNFAAFNCVSDYEAAGLALARLLEPGSPLVLVVFGTLCPMEMLVQLMRVDLRAAFRRLRSGPVAARLGGQHFTVHYPSSREFQSAFAPYFQLERIRGIGVCVPPSAAEPAISSWPRLLSALERLDRFASRPFARLGDHVLLRFTRTHAPAES